MRQDVGIILQARFASARLPGKALESIGSRTILEHCLRRLTSAGVARVVLATTTQPEDDALVEVAEGIGVPVFRGDRDDVLRRVLDAANAFGFKTIVRATGDNPGTDIQAPGRLLAVLRSSGADYACENGLPYGSAVEVVTHQALTRADHEATEPDDREHVTTYLRRHPATFKVLIVPAPAPLRRPDVRLTVDTAEDLQHVRQLFARVGSDMPSLAELIAVAGASRSAEASASAKNRKVA